MAEAGETGDCNVSYLNGNKIRVEASKSKVESFFKSIFTPVGLEFHPFQIGWYNELVGPKFVLEYPPSTLAYCIISGPDTFEKSVLPYLKSEFKANPNLNTNDPLDDAMVHFFRLFKKELQDSGIETEMFHDFELHPNRRPKVLVQTAAHVSGAAQYFHTSNLPKNIQDEKFSKQSDLCGIAMHPLYGGWFAIRGVILFPSIVSSPEEDLKRPNLLNLIPDNEKVVKLLEEFAYNWEADQWRNIYLGDGIEYSQDFKDFLAVQPGNRWKFIQERGYLNP